MFALVRSYYLLNTSEKECIAFKNELVLQEDLLKKEMQKQNMEIQQLNVEKESLNSVLQMSSLKCEEFENLSRTLQKEVDELHKACDNSSMFLNKELENVTALQISNFHSLSSLTNFFIGI